MLRQRPAQAPPLLEGNRLVFKATHFLDCQECYDKYNPPADPEVLCGVAAVERCRLILPSLDARARERCFRLSTGEEFRAQDLPEDVFHEEEVHLYVPERYRKFFTIKDGEVLHHVGASCKHVIMVPSFNRASHGYLNFELA